MKNYLLKHAMLGGLVCLSFTSTAQVGIGTNTPRGALDINESTTNTSGLVLPTNSDHAVMVNPQGGKPVAGTIMYDSTSDCIRLYKQTEEWSGCLLEESVLRESTGELVCTSIQVKGSYMANMTLSSMNTVEVQVNVTTPGSYTIITNQINGYSFTGTGTFGSIGTHTVILEGVGTPVVSGTDTFTVSYDGGTCTFNVSVAKGISLGNFEDPAKSCLAIYNEYQAAGQTVEDGEYYIQGKRTDAVKTYCDMTNGGYTLIKSYSEFQVFGTDGKGPENDLLTTRQGLDYFEDRGYAEAIGESGIVNYELFLLPTSVRKNIRSGVSGNQYRVRIVEDEANVANNNDAWANNNYAEYDFSPSPDNIDFIENGAWATDTPIINSKIFGKEYKSLGSGAGGNYVSFDGQAWNYTITATQVGAMGTKHDYKEPNYAFTYKTSDGSIVNTNLTEIGYVWGIAGNDTFNHHIGKCDADDYQGATGCLGTSRRAHSFNGGKGRFVQWFVK